MPELEEGVRRWMEDYNRARIHQGLDYDYPWSLYRPEPEQAEAA